MRKIGELKGKPIIEGNPNEIKKNQIHYKESDGSITLSERKEDNTLSSVTSGSGSGEGGGDIKKYYYKVLKHKLDTGGTPFDFFTQFGIALIDTCIFEGHKITYRQHTYNDATTATSAMEYIINKDDRVQAFSFLDIETYLLMNNTTITISKGTLYDRSNELIGKFYPGTEEEIIQMKEMINSMYSECFQEITKEEYESLIAQ